MPALRHIPGSANSARVQADLAAEMPLTAQLANRLLYTTNESVTDRGKAQ